MKVVITGKGRSRFEQAKSKGVTQSAKEHKQEHHTDSRILNRGNHKVMRFIPRTFKENFFTTRPEKFTAIKIWNHCPGAGGTS